MIDRMKETVIKALWESLPMEVTVIDANDEVIGWNKHTSRIFKRPLSAMGLNFRQCHPETSLAKVEQIVLEMKTGSRNHARFWIDLNLDNSPHKILIEFYALRDDDGTYLGCMECTQDITALQQLTGQKRLLD